MNYLKWGLFESLTKIGHLKSRCVQISDPNVHLYSGDPIFRLVHNLLVKKRLVCKLSGF